MNKCLAAFSLMHSFLCHSFYLQIDRFLYSTDNQVVAGALLAVGIVNCGVQDEVDPALALLSGVY